MKKLLFLIHTLGGGGAEKALINLVNHLDSTKYDITVETMFDDGINAKELKPHIHYISKHAPCPKGISKILRFFPSSLLYRYFIGKAQYGILIAYMHGVPVKVISGNKKCKKIAWLHNGNPETSTMFSCWFSKRNAFRAYQSCDAVVGVCNSVAETFSEYTGISKNVKVVYNTLDVDHIISLAKAQSEIVFDNDYVNIVSTGRLVKEKGYTRLINIISRLKSERYPIRLYLIGSGSEEGNLKNQVSSSALDNDVFFLGFQDNPYKYVSKCDVFICSSFTEGLSTATIEALILGKAIVSTKVSGADEILGDNEYGIIVDNSDEGIYQGIKKLLDDRKLLSEYSVKAKNRADFFSVSKTVEMAENVIDSTIN